MRENVYRTVFTTPMLVGNNLVYCESVSVKQYCGKMCASVLGIRIGKKADTDASVSAFFVYASGVMFSFSISF